MYDYFLILKGNNKDLAIKEFENLWYLYNKENIRVKQVKNIYYKFKAKTKIESDNELLSRLTLTNKLFLTLEKFNSFEDYKIWVSNQDFSYLENKTFSIAIRRANSNIEMSFLEKDIAKPLWDSLKTPKVNLDNADFKFSSLLVEKDTFYFCLEIFENNKDYLRRMPKLRPVKMPYTLKSDMARACINLSSSKEGILLDPFCGIGGILLEGHDMGYKVIGNDISWNDLKYMKENFKHFYPKAKPIRILADCKTIFLKEDTVDSIVTDIPYGKSSRKLGLDLYEDFLKQSRICLKENHRLIVIYANFVDFKKLALKYFEEEYEIKEYINKSMTRNMLVLKNTKKL